MAEQLLTKCPHCGTTFRLSQQHLQIAGGAVRCGACYQVFHASEYIVKTAVVEEIVPPEAPAAPKVPLPDPLADFNIDGIDGMDVYTEASFDLPNPDEDLFAEDYHQKLVEGADESHLAFDDDAKPTKKTSAKTGGSEDWAKQLLEELGEAIDDDDDDEDHFSLRKRPAPPPPKTNTHFSSIQSGNEIFSEVDPGKSAKSAKPPQQAPANPSARAPQKTKRLEEELSDSFKSLGLKGFSDDPFSIDDLNDEDEKASGDVDESWAKAMLEELEGDKPGNRKIALDSFDYAIEDDIEEEESLFAAKPLSRTKNEALQKARERSAKQPFSEAKAPATPKAAFSSESNISSFDNDFFGQFDENSLEVEDIHLEDAVGALSSIENVPEAPPPKMSSADIAAKVRAHAAQLAMEQAPKPHYFKTVMLVAGNLLLITTLITQIAYFKFDELSRWPQLRPLYSLACTKIGCKLPAQTDTSKIRTNNLVVRSHPTAPQALSVDAMISNEASYRQPFPIIELTFEDINGGLVASRGFTPAEYIKDPAVNPKHMAPNTPFHVGLEIVDPGPSAANYHLRYLPVPD